MATNQRDTLPPGWPDGGTPSITPVPLVRSPMKFYDQHGEVTPERMEIIRLREYIERIEAKIDRLLSGSVEASSSRVVSDTSP